MWGRTFPCDPDPYGKGAHGKNNETEIVGIRILDLAIHIAKEKNLSYSQPYIGRNRNHQEVLNIIKTIL